MRGCSECRHSDLDVNRDPCDSCENGNGDSVNWEAPNDLGSINIKLDKIMEYLGIEG